MADRDKVIRHFKDAIEASGNNNKWRFVRLDIIEDAIDLLKAQEPVKPIRFTLMYWRCGNCRREIDKYEGDMYCPRCGRKVKWDD